MKSFIFQGRIYEIKRGEVLTLKKSKFPMAQKNSSIKIVLPDCELTIDKIAETEDESQFKISTITTTNGTQLNLDNISKLTKSELLEYADKFGIKADKKLTKKALIELIEQHNK